MLCPLFLLGQQGVVSKIKILATGDLRQEFENDRKDELGQLAQSMHELVSQLRNMLSSVSSNSEQLAATAEQPPSLSKQTSQLLFLCSTLFESGEGVCGGLSTFPFCWISGH